MYNHAQMMLKGGLNMSIKITGNASPQEAQAYVDYLQEWWQQDLKDMVEKDYNHPSVIMYSDL